MTELDKLEQYLINHRITYERIDKDARIAPNGKYLLSTARHQICVPESGENQKWDAICQPYSYGYEAGLLEIYGDIVTKEDDDTVVGWLTAEDVIKRLEK